MLNNKGQSLVIFVLMIPILLGIMSMVIDIGNVIYYKQDLSNINKIAIDYGLSNMNDDNIVNDINKVIKYNNNDISSEIRFNDMEIYVNSTYYVDGIFSNIFNTDGYLVKSIYKGYIDSDNKRVIKKIK